MEALLGVVFVAQLPSQQPEAIFQHPQPTDEEILGQDHAPPAAAFTATAMASATAGGLGGLPPRSSGGSVTAGGVPPTSLPAAAVSAERSGGSGGEIGGGGGGGAVSSAAGSATGSPMGLLPVPMTTSAEDLRLQLREFFGIPANIFAKLMLPDEELCNRPFYLELDGGRRQTSHQHGPWSHLLFVGFPCNVAEFSRPEVVRKANGAGHGDTIEKVQRFNIVHVLDSRRASRREKHTSQLWEVSAHLSRALVSEEARVGYLSSEVHRIRASPPEFQKLSLDGSSGGVGVDGSNSLGLDRLLSDCFDGVHEKGYQSLRVNGSILCQVCVFPKHEAPAPPSAGHALALTCDREELQRELALDSADIVRRVIDAADPTTSLDELMVKLALPLGTLQRVAQHLVYWRKARVVEVFQRDTYVAVAPGIDTDPGSLVAARFQEWQRQNRSKGPGMMLTFSEVISAFSGGRTLQSASDHLRKGVEFQKVLEWLVAEGILMQLATYYHFLPTRADKSRKPVHPDLHIGSDLRREFSHHLMEDELRLLATRAADTDELWFLCRFVAEFVRPHCRADGCRFQALVESFNFGRKRADKLLADNRDVFVPYVCRC